LSDELRRYGYVFSLQRSVALYIVTIGFVMLLGRFYSLGFFCQSVLCLSAVFMMPLFLRNMWKGRYLQRRFSDINIYMEQYLYSFQKSGKILTTLQEVQSLFEKGEMWESIGRSIDHIEMTFHEGNVEQCALEMLEEEYGYSGLKMIHGFSLQVEKNGGEYHQSILLLLEARRLWSDRVYSLLKEKRKRRIEILLSVATSLLLCSLIYLLSEDMGVSVAEHPLAQSITLIVLLLDLWIFYRADKKLSADYMREEVQEDLNPESMWNRFTRYRNSGRFWDRMGERVLKRKLGREIEKRFPEWLMEVSLLLQSENVQVAIFKSYEGAPEVLKPALRQFILELQQNPANIGPYLQFLKEFTLPEVRSTMKMLYSLSEGSGGDADAQIADMIHRNQLLMDKAEKIKNEDRMAGMYLLFLAPQVTAGCKLLVDMMLLLFLYMGQMSVNLQ